MPLYEYQCPKCGRFEVIRKFSDAPLSACPTCGREIQKLPSAPAIQFKGSGWYVTDYARKSPGGDASKGESGKTGESAKGGESAKTGEAAKGGESAKTGEAAKGGEAATKGDSSTSTGTSKDGSASKNSSSSTAK